ncbi:MAG: DeoR/GlpR family DNA-binding transcription regulator [bacterium]|nr:DeoR/GlpR family DNA-binding transcription regulator [bacterium]
MLPEERLEAIVRIVSDNRSITNQELADLTDSSLSTIRRDVTELASRGMVVKVHGGAMSVSDQTYASDSRMSERRTKNAEAKQKIAAYAAKLIKPGDVVYIDAGTTTEFLTDFITEKEAVYVTNAVSHAVRLVSKGLRVHVIGGMLKPVTEAVIGGEAVVSLRKFNFSLGFFGANGISSGAGITTPDINEAVVKQQAVNSCNRCYVLADSSKLDKVSTVRFADPDDVIIITEKLNAACKGCQMEVAQ